MLSMICSSSAVPSVVTTSACVSPRVKSAEPCVRGRTSISQVMGRIWSGLPSVRADALFRDGRPHDLLLHVLEERLHGLDVGLRQAVGEVRLRLGPAPP